MEYKHFLLGAFIFFSISQSDFAQVMIGRNSSPDPAAILELSSTDRGLLLPRIHLTDLHADLDGNANTPQPAGLVIYNTGPTYTSGLYIWNGEEWRVFEEATAVNAEIESLMPGSAILEPSRFVMGEEFHGIMRLPYQGGNGGIYLGGQTFQSSNNTGLTAKLKSGKLEYGTGYLSFEVDGTPSATSPVSATFNISALGKTAEVTVGDQESASIITTSTVGPVHTTNDNGATGFHRTLKTPDGRFSVRLFVPDFNTYSDGDCYYENADVQIRTHIQGGTTISYSCMIGYTGGATGSSACTFNIPTANDWYGTSGASGNSVSSVKVSSSNKNAAWGDRNVFYLYMPELRRYTWTTTDNDDKTMYVLDFTMKAPTGTARADNINQTMIYLQIQQIEANN
ncbi:MAG: hypothetical protein LBR64_04200 [Dysgonamonadaceae bacterium]|jgi:hypothetical protein|nr:hypothetical protein [Dysgonamonadaceae bacterium]